MIHDTALTIGIVLRPYQAIGSKTYSNGTLPPDILPPFIKGDSGAEVVRLRPSTAAMLLHLAKVKPGDIVLDPCAGLGTSRWRLHSTISPVLEWGAMSPCELIALLAW